MHPALKPAHESQVMISTEGFDGVADVRSKRRQSDQAAPAAVWSCATWKWMITKLGFIAAMELSPQKARILLMLALMTTKATESFFEKLSA
jgi:L-asparaginase/Glu-tRNA(Gln) amidotransferase subunit D